MIMMVTLRVNATEESYEDNLEGLIDDESNLYETSADEVTPVFL